MFKVNNRNTRKRCEICSKLTIITVNDVNFEHIFQHFLVLLLFIFIRSHSFSTYAKFYKKLSCPLPSAIRTRMCAYQGVRNGSFSESFTYVLNEWSLMYLSIHTNENVLLFVVISKPYLTDFEGVTDWTYREEKIFFLRKNSSNTLLQKTAKQVKLQQIIRKNPF